MKELAILVESLELALHTHTEIDITLAAEATTGWLDITPDTPFEATIIYGVTIADCPAGIFRVESDHKGYTLGNKIVNTDEMQHGIYCWLYVTGRESFRVRVTNLDAQSQSISMTMWHLNVMKLGQLDIIRMVLWEYVAQGSIMMAMRKGYAPPFEYMPEISEFIKKKYGGL